MNGQGGLDPYIGRLQRSGLFITLESIKDNLVKHYTIILSLLSLFWQSVNAQGREKELDSLITRAEQLPESIEKAQVLSRIHERMMFTDPDKARDYAQQAFDLSEKLDYKKGIANGYLQFGNYFSNRTENDSATYFYELSLEKFKEIKSIRGQIFANHSLAGIEREKGNYDKAIEITHRNIALYNDQNRNETDLKEFNLIGAEYEVLGSVYMDKGNYTLALNETLNALRFFEEVGDKVRKGDALLQLGQIEYKLGNFNASLAYEEEAFSIYRDEDDKVYQSYAANHAGLAAEALGDMQKAEEYQRAAMTLAQEVGVKSTLSTALRDLGRIYSKKGLLNDARTFLEESYTVSESTGIQLDIASSLKELAQVDYQSKEFSEALKKMDRVIEMAESIGAVSILGQSYKERSQIHESLGKYTNAIADLRTYQIINDSIFNSRKSQQIEELKTIYETEKKEAEIALQEEEINTLNAQAKVDQLTKGLYAGGMASALALSGLLVFGYRQKMKKNKIAREKQEEIYKQEIEHKKKELASQTLHLVQKNTFIQELMDNLENIKNSPEKFKMEFRRIVMLLKKENASDKDWEVFKTYFAEVHNDFDQKLKTIYQDISEKEIRLAAFLRMNLTTKEIAATLNVLPDSILKSKYRLKKKLGLDKDMDLSNFLGSL
ncbi:tetratricopeptide repeat protein [Allomuricauda sp. ARW1Y1]|jgi:tetratricopeptide (TPR) repeat protein|uniref:tetratricopeptide repeat protein n=1 Tax=Allomuricauda sp. ARW1Y1 TaxID=2663843 RepID=UPI0015CB532A|nr:tetratricopeptide repeat protein [Muricauda sp. ARW1Y1]NYJ29219.1 tetratricopeptide (TPR) repeat protein [Muricauda sp. ARW1Y1]